MMSNAIELLTVVQQIDVYIKNGMSYYVFDPNDERYKTYKGFEPWLSSLSKMIFKDVWDLKEAWYEDGYHFLMFRHKKVGGDLSFRLTGSRLFVINANTGGFDVVSEDIFKENYTIFEG